jgi:signal transduction histidine kinase
MLTVAKSTQAEASGDETSMRNPTLQARRRARSSPVPPASVTGRSIMTDPVKAAMIRTLLLQIGSQSAAGFVVTGYMVGTAWAFTNRLVIALWAVSVLAVIVVRWTISRRFVRAEPPDAALAGWVGTYMMLTIVSGVLWGIGVLVLMHPEEPVTVALTLGCLYSVAAGSTPSCAYHPPAILAIIVPIYLPVFGKLIATGDLGYILLGSASLLYGITMIGYCRVQSRALREGFRIRFENAELVERLRRETEVADQARQAAEQANLAKSQFLAAASHDLRQPLYALGLFSSSLEELRLDGKGRDVVRRIQDSIGAMETSFEGLLDLSKLEAGIVKPRFEAVEVDAMFDRISQVFRPLALERGLELRLRCDGECVWSDPVLLEQVAGNLVSNAIRATTRGGVLLAARRRRDAVRFEVWDTGSGIPEQDLERIFDDYVQLNNPERDRRRGLGLGLAITRRSVALLGARIDVASRLGRGSRFGFAQPLYVGQPQRRALQVAQETVALRRGTDPVLLVEDDEDVRAALSDLLARWGVAFEAHADARSALERLRRGRRFALVITDQRLAGDMTGLDLIRAMRTQLPDAPPAVIITGEMDSPLLREARQADIPVLHKPVKVAQLRQLLGEPARSSPNAAGR